MSQCRADRVSPCIRFRSCWSRRTQGSRLLRAGASFSFLPLPGPSDCPPSTEGWTAPGMRIVDLELGSLKTCGFSFCELVAGIAEHGGPAQLSHDSRLIGS